MARPTKRGLEYFPLDVDMEADSAVAFVEAKHGLEGYAVFVRLLQRIYRDGYYLAWDDRELYIFARSVAVPVDRVAAVVDDCLSERLFDLELFKKYGVLTSRGIQSRYVSATGRRAGVEMQEELLLLDKKTITSSHITVIDTYTGTLVSADIKIVIDDVMLTETLHSEVIDDMMLTETPQSKVKESRVLKNLSSFENDGDEDFDTFWHHYPRKVGKAAAKKAWAKAVKTECAQKIIASLEAYPFDRKDDGRFIPHAATWLNGERWADETDTSEYYDCANYDRLKYPDILIARPDGERGMAPGWLDDPARWTADGKEKKLLNAPPGYEDEPPLSEEEEEESLQAEIARWEESKRRRRAEAEEAAKKLPYPDPVFI